MHRIIKSPPLQGELVVIQNKPPAALQHEDKKEEKFDTRSVDEIAQERANVILMEAQRQAEALVRTAQLEAARIKGEADSLHGQAKELGHREGFEEGLAQGRQAAEKEMKLAVMEKFDQLDRLTYVAAYGDNKIVRIVIAFGPDGRGGIQNFSFSPLKVNQGTEKK